MRTHLLKTEFSKIKNLIENIDPGGFGARDEYDNIVFSIINNNRRVTDLPSLSRSIEAIVRKEFGDGNGNLNHLCREIAKQILDWYPQGIQ